MKSLDYYFNDDIRSSINKTIKNTDDLNKELKNIYYLKNHNKSNFRKNKEFLSTGDYSNRFNDINTNIDFNDFNKYKTLGKSVNLNDNKKKYQINKNDFKLMDCYLRKLLQLFINRLKNFIKKNLLQKFYKTLKKYIEIKEKNILKNKEHKFIDKEIFNKNSHRSYTIYSPHEIHKTKTFNKHMNNSNTVFKKKLIFRNDNIKKKDDFNLKTAINKSENQTKNIFRKKSAYSSRINNLKMLTHINLNNINQDITLENRININTLDDFTFLNNYHIKNKLSSSIITKKSPNYKFFHTKKQSYDSQNNKSKNNNLIIGLEKAIIKKKSYLINNINIKPKKLFNYTSSDNKINITIKYYIYIPKIKHVKKIESKMNNFDKNLLKITINDNFCYLFKTKENNSYKNYCSLETNCEYLGNSLNKKNIENFINSEKINKGIKLLQNIINKNYEENFNTSDITVQSELVNNYSEKENKGKINLNYKVKEKQIKPKNNINSKLIKIITSLENKENRKLLKNYFNNFHSLLNNKIKKQILVQKTEVFSKIKKTISSNSFKDEPISLENNSEEIFIKSNSKYSSEFISPSKLDKIKNIESFNESIKKENISSIKLGNESSDYSFISMHLVPKFYSSRNVNELIKKKDESFYEYYHKSQDFIFSFRLLLISNYLHKKNLDQD